MNRIDTLNQFLKDSPEDNFLQHALALEHIKIGNDEDAKTLFQKILQKDPLYVGSYYHLAKLHERTGQTSEAISTYEKGMIVCKQVGDNHSYNELQAAYEDLVY